MRRVWIVGLCAAFILFAAVGCSKEPENPEVDSGYNPSFEEKDLDSSWKEDDATQIVLSDSGSKVDGEGAASLEDGVKISKGGVYVISGKLADGRIVVEVEPGEELKLVFNGIDITSLTSAPVYISNGDAMIVLADGTENVLTDAAAYQYADHTAAEPNACLYGDDNLTFTGRGKLTINANFNNGIGTKDELRISSGTFVIYAANNAIKGNDCVLIQDAVIRMESNGDGIKSDESKLKGHGLISIGDSDVEIVSEDDGLQAISLISIESGQIKITAKGKEVNCDGITNIAEGVRK